MTAVISFISARGPSLRTIKVIILLISLICEISYKVSFKFPSTETSKRKYGVNSHKSYLVFAYLVGLLFLSFCGATQKNIIKSFISQHV